ncbi:MAG: hypothetical protein EXR75_05230 [Myxococcales bacterium]|nr:hypothetical protein [Myxococcales bacterium]
MDGAYAVHSRVGVGLWFGLSRGASRRGGDYRFNGYSPELVVEEAAYFAAAQLPVRVWGDRDLAIELVPRAGFATGSLELSHDAENNDVPQSIASGGTTSGPVSKNAPAQNTVVFGAAITLTSYTYHLGLDTGLLFAPVGPPGELARAHDFGGFYFAFGGTIDG